MYITALIGIAGIAKIKRVNVSTAKLCILNAQRAGNTLILLPLITLMQLMPTKEFQENLELSKIFV